MSNASIQLKNVHVEFPVYGANSRSIKREFIRVSSGGKVSDDHRIITVNALSDVSFSLAPGDRLGLVGHNGAGKSTLLRTLARIYAPTKGTIHTQGSISALLDVMFGVDPESTGFENIIIRGTLHGLTRKAIMQKIDEIAEFTELGDYLYMPVRTYSSGMSLRLAFSISTSIQPQILILDEVISVGDASFLTKAKTRINQIIDGSEIVVMTSHDDSIILNTCNKILWLDAGSIRAFGSNLQEVLNEYHGVKQPLNADSEVMLDN